MVEFNIHIGQELNNVTCCDVHPHVMEYHENFYSFEVKHTCPKCGNVGSFGLLVPRGVREKQIKSYREAGV